LPRFLRSILAAAVLVIPVVSPASDGIPPAAPGPALSLTQTATRIEQQPESPLRRFESVFFITLPFSSLYSSLIMLGVAAIAQGGNVDFTSRYQVATASLAVALAAWSGWRDASTGGIKLEGVKLDGVGERLACVPSWSPGLVDGSGFLAEREFR
jgi:hypothetical protein